MNDKKNILNPDLINIDDRSISELINYVSQLSKEISYYNGDDVVGGDFYGMFSNDQSFLISEISKFEISKLKSKRIKLIRQYDNSENLKIKINVLFEYLDFTRYFFDTLNDWFRRSTDKKIVLINSNLNSEIESLIKVHASKLLKDYNTIITSVKHQKLFKDSHEVNLLYFDLSIWKNSSSSMKEEISTEDKSLLVDSLFKKLILINNSLFKLIENLVKRSIKKLEISLSKSDHNPQIGLLFSFLKLYKHLQNDINKITKKHLDYYYTDILEQEKIKIPPNKTFAVFSIDNNIVETRIGKGQKIIAGQYDDGSAIKYKLDNDLSLNNAKISFLMTIFLSKNSVYDFNSRYRLIASVFSKTICSNISEVDKFNKDSNLFNALGVDQNFIIDDEINMDLAEIGFLLGSSVLKLGKSKRDIRIDFVFDNDSVRHLGDLIIDISNNTDMSEDEVFHRIFSNSFLISYTGLTGWETINNYEILIPDDWSNNTVSILIKLSKSNSAFCNLNNELHQYHMNVETPMIRFNINQNAFYNAYAFLNKMKFEEIKITTGVSNLKDLKIFRDGQSIQNSSEFDIFGPTPKYNSKIYIGCEELFNKKVIDFNLKWEYTNLDEVNFNLEKHYKGYDRNFSYKVFKLKLSILSDFNYLVEDNENYMFSMFDTIDDKISITKTHDFSYLNKTQLSPNFKINNDYINNFSNDYETGLIKIELDNPNHAFGHKLYPKVYAANVSKNINSKNGEMSESFINEPFAPKISEISINYSAESTLYFNQKNRNENDFDENNSFFHISPYGIKKTFSEEAIENSMFYDLKNEGELIIGFKSSNKIRNIDLFFEIVKNENEYYDFSSKIEWHYTTKYGWKLLTNRNILNDQTNNLLNSGVISILLPNDFNSEGYILNKNEFYIKAISKNRADQLGLIKSIYTNSVYVTEVIPENEYLRLNQLKSNSLQNLESKVNGIISVSQPIDSPKINLIENNTEYYYRISNLLKHKNRPVSKSDFEHFVLNKFSYLNYVKCVSNDDNLLSIICLKKIENYQHIDEVKLSSAEINEISSFLNHYISPQFSIEIVNPIFEDMWVKCSILFKDLNPGRAIELLNKDLLEFICPWKNSKSIEIINSKINNIDILNFIKTRYYVDYVTGFSVIHFKKDSKEMIKIYDSALENYDNDFIKSGNIKSIIIPRNNHKIKILDRLEYEKPEPINFDELEIDQTFISEKGFEIEKNDSIKNSDEEDYKNLQFIIK